MEDIQAGRRRQWDRAILSTLFSGAGLQISVLLSSLVALPFVTRSLSTAEYGVLATLSGLVALLSFSDFGVGGALATRLADARGRDDWTGARAAVSTAVLASAAIGCLVAAFLASSVWFLPWDALLGARELGDNGLRLPLMAAAAAAGLTVCGSTGQRMLYGVDRGALANVVLFIGTVVTSALLVLGAAAGWPLFAFVLCSLSGPAVAGIACGFVAVRRFATDLRPRLEDASWAEWNALKSASGWYFLVGLAGAASFQTDALIVSGLLGAGVAGVFGIAIRLYGLISQAIYPGMLQLWPAFGDAYARRDGVWIRSRLLWFTLGGGVVSAALGIALVVVGPWLTATWLTAELVPGRGLLIALTCWTTLSLMTAPTFLLLNATGRVKVHALTAAAVALVNLPVSLFLTHAVGVSGPVWGSVIATVLCVGPPGALALRSLFRNVGAGP